jgi:uracil-DNA glycosylase
VLFASLYRTGFASQPESINAGDGLVLTDLRVTAPVHCAPPENKPTVAERDRCAAYLARELELLGPQVAVAVVLGAFGWQTLLATLEVLGWAIGKPRPKFGHGATATVQHPDGRILTVLGSYHVSQHNTFTGRLTPAMLDEVFVTARRLAGSPAS